MNAEDHPTAGASQEKLPFEPITLMKGLWRKHWWMVLIIVLAAGIGLGASLMFGKRIYHAQTIMLFKPGASGTPDENKAALQTLLNLAKIEANLREVRKRLHLDAILPDVGRAIAVYEQGETGMVVFRAEWTDAETAAKMANTLRIVFFKFLEDRKERLSSKPDQQQTELKANLSESKAALKQADDRLGEFVTVNQIVDLEKQVQWTLEEKTNLEFVYQNSTVEKRTLDLQINNLDRIISDLGKRAGQEADSSNAAEDLGDLNIRFRRLRDAIHDDRWKRAQSATLAQLGGEYDRTRRLYKTGVATKAEYEKAKNALDRQTALSIDTPQIRQWKTEISKLDKIVIPKKGGSTGPSAKLLHQMMLRYFDVQLSHVAVAAKVEYLAGALDRVQEKLNRLTKLQRELVGLKRGVASAEADKKRLEGLMTKVKTSQHPAPSQLELLSAARPPIWRTRSNRKLIAIGLTGVLSFLGLLVLLMIELFNPTVRSSAELAHKLDITVLGQAPELPPELAGLPDCNNPEAVEQLKIAARRLRMQLPERGAKVLIASALAQEGKSFAAANLACYLGRRDERVLLVETPATPQTMKDQDQQEPGLSSLVLDGPPKAGLGEYLNLLAESGVEIVYPTCLPGVELLAAGREPIEAELLAGQRMTQLVEELTDTYSLVIWDGPSVLSGEIAATMATLVDGVIMVVAAGKTKTGELKRARARLSEKGTPILGAIMNRVRPPFDEVRGL